MQAGRVVLISFITSLLTSVVAFYLLRSGGTLFAEELQVPSVVGLRVDQARVLLEPKGLLLLVMEERKDDKVEPGHIILQSPLDGSRVKKGTEVRVILSKGQEKLKVPQLAELTQTEAMTKLSSMGLRVGAITRQVHDKIAADHVVATIPAFDTEVETDTSINLVLSAGQGEVAVPKLYGKWPKQAEEALEKIGLKVGKRTYGYNEDLRGGVIIRQDPAAETQVTKGSTVNLVINESD